MEELKLNFLEELKASDKYLLLLCLCAFIGLVVMQAGGDMGTLGLIIAIVSAILALIYKVTAKKKHKSEVQPENVKTTKIS